MLMSGCCCGPGIPFTVHVTGCGGLNLPGVSVTLTQGGTTYGPVTTDSSGNALLHIGSLASVTPAVSGPRWTTTTFGAVTPTNGGTTTVAMSGHEATGYHCCGGVCTYPLKDTLTITSPAYGAHTVTYSGTGWPLPTTMNFSSGTCGTYTGLSTPSSALSGASGQLTISAFESTGSPCCPDGTNTGSPVAWSTQPGSITPTTCPTTTAASFVGSAGLKCAGTLMETATVTE